MKWILATDQNPEDDTHVLVYGPKYPDMAVIYYDGCCYDCGDSETGVDITHWMLLPERP